MLIGSDPEYAMCGELTEKFDVYSFGVVLFKVLSARPALVKSLPTEMVSLANWAMESQKNGQLERIIDPNLVGKKRPDSLNKFGETAVKCLAETGLDRPSMGEVLWKLKYALHLQEAEATNNFDDKFLIGMGIFGKVYRGVLRDGSKVALKRRKPESPQVYDYMENGNLSRHLYGSDLRLPTMSWEQRLEIRIGAARGLHYLHNSVVIHRDVKSTNILLDENFVAKITDFGICKTMPELDQTHLSTMMKGSIGYIDPEYLIRRQLTEKFDVYSFGVVLFEVLYARPALGRSHMISLAEWAVESQKMGQLEQIVDPNLAARIKPESLRMFGETAVKCLASSSENRPSMGDVLWKLEYALRLQESIIQDDLE
ncbi:hypothetical protein RDI58_012913 [Solanum bulbocastanum]|uniref:Protein kinase domain-containing protein n=1 Tax=Solanum bulbocastanum TaxID=147425 RepID=A0AAN8YDH7_SOLBU